MQQLRVGVIGLGFGQSVHIPVFKNNPQCKVVAVGSTRLEKAQMVAGTHGIQAAYDDFKRLLDSEKLDILSIATPPNEQYEIAKEAIARGVALLLEKPLCRTLEQGQELMKMATHHSVPAMVDFEFPEIPVWRELKRQLQQSAIGRVEQIEVNWSTMTYMNQKRLSSWKTETSNGGGALYSFGSHIFHYMEWFFGSVTALRCHLERSASDERATDTKVLLDLKFSSGALAKVTVDTENAFIQEHKLSVKGSMGVLELNNPSKDYINGFVLTSAIDSGIAKWTENELKWNTPFNDLCLDGRILAVSALANRLVKWRQTGEASEPNLASSVRVQEMIALSLKSHDHGASWQDCVN
ncbi:MAG: Gfo/Idh/MocA family oxidoreductase [Pseudobdellovibrionaceae bacterium]